MVGSAEEEGVVDEDSVDDVDVDDEAGVEVEEEDGAADEDCDATSTSKPLQIPSNAEYAVPDKLSGQRVSRQDFNADASEEQTHLISSNLLQVEEDLTTSAAQANKQAGGVARDGAT